MTESEVIAEACVLQHFLDAQRAAVLAIVEGLGDDQLLTAVLPSGWTFLGMIEHLGHAERRRFSRSTATSASDRTPCWRLGRLARGPKESTTPRWRMMSLIFDGSSPT